MADLEKAKLNPASVYKKPADVLDDASLSNNDKTDILERWAYDEREKEVATEENMAGPNGDNNILDEILKALRSLGAESNHKKSPPTKQG